VLDLSLPGQSGLDLLRRLTLRRPGLRILVFTMHDAPATVAHCLRAGAAGFVTKVSAPEVLLEALRLVACGELALSSDVAQARPAPGQPLHAVLSVREFDILQRLVAGQGIEQIARAVHLSVKTVANYQTEIRRKLGVRNAVELLRYVRENGIADV
jgi:DNA-binding NarL/FixJ family response regulator